MKKIISLLFLFVIFCRFIPICNAAPQQTIDAVTRVVESSNNNDIDFGKLNAQLKNIEDSIKNGQFSEDIVLKKGKY